MAIFTFSTKSKRPEDEQLVMDVKDYCERRNINFSGIVVKLLRDYKESLNDR